MAFQLDSRMKFNLWLTIIMCASLLLGLLWFSNNANKVEIWSCYSFIDTFQDPFKINGTNQGLEYHKICYRNNETPLQIICYSCVYRGQTFLTKIQLNKSEY